jgi:hypothetical protein
MLNICDIPILMSSPNSNSAVLHLGSLLIPGGIKLHAISLLHEEQNYHYIIMYIIVLEYYILIIINY